MTASAVPAAFVADLVAAARGYVRLGEGVEAGLLAAQAEAAVLLAERFCGVAIVARAHDEVLPVTEAWQRLAGTPVRAIEPPTVGGVALPVESYAIDIDAGGDGWVRVADPGAARAAVRYTAGLASGWAEVPAPLAQGVVMLVAHLFGHRENDAAPPAAVAALWRPYRRMQLMGAVR